MPKAKKKKTNSKSIPDIKEYMKEMGGMMPMSKKDMLQAADINNQAGEVWMSHTLAAMTFISAGIKTDGFDFTKALYSIIGSSYLDGYRAGLEKKHEYGKS